MNKQEQEWFVVVNPNAGSRKAAKEWPRIKEILQQEGFNFSFELTQGPKDAMRITEKALQDGYRKLIAVGGDGTLNEVANGILRQLLIPSTDIILGMIPVGTGNDWCRFYHVPQSPIEAIQFLKEGHTKLQDTCKVTYTNGNSPGERFFVNLAGIGFDAEVVRKTNLQKSRGRGGAFLYLWYLLTTLFSYKTARIVLQTDTAERKGEYFSISVGICKFDGGGMIRVPHALADDGLLDITAIRKIGKWEVIRSLPLLFNGKIDRHKKVESFQSKKVKISSQPPVFLETDGESLGSSPLGFEIIPLSLRIIVSREN